MRISKIEGHRFLSATTGFRHPPETHREIGLSGLSVAKGGKLVAYRWDGSRNWTNDKLVWVGHGIAHDNHSYPDPRQRSGQIKGRHAAAREPQKMTANGWLFAARSVR